MEITGWWSALGLAFAATGLAHMVTRGAGALRRKDLGKRSMKSAYVHVAPGLGGGLKLGRAVQWSLFLPVTALIGCALALCGAVAMTIFPKYSSAVESPDLYHALNTPFYVGLAAAYIACVFMLGQHFYARYQGSSVGHL